MKTKQILSYSIGIALPFLCKLMGINPWQGLIIFCLGALCWQLRYE